jgi:hypothetical protein
MYYRCTFAKFFKAKEFDLRFIETSAKNALNITLSFHTLALDIMARFDSTGPERVQQQGYKLGGPSMGKGNGKK